MGGGDEDDQHDTRLSGEGGGWRWNCKGQEEGGVGEATRGVPRATIRVKVDRTSLLDQESVR